MVNNDSIDLRIEKMPKENEKSKSINNKNRQFHKELHDGAIVWIDCDPQAGHEQSGRRPALIVSNDVFNQVIPLRFVLPITHTDRNSPFHVKLNSETKTDGYVMCEQLRSFDLVARKYEYIEDVPEAILNEVKSILIESIRKE